MASEFKSLSFHEWEKLFFQEQSDEPEIMIESIEEAVDIAQTIPEESIWESEEPETDVEVEETNGALEKLKNLCRVCSSHGLISISSQLTPKLFSMKPSGDMKLWQISIANILSEVSGEKVGKKTNFIICSKCSLFVYVFRSKLMTAFRNSFANTAWDIFNMLTQ